ncbi:H-type lectin domain-containing protein [Phaeobacter marinintestinus]|uniref:H-type lectin domain-containing protein n=1 Tax=Falsiphaeobacter marinintestinus TaxID=1492905 RepID=UPI0011B48766|nr:H-type lectin domain-containing protein [Phaeobacter marinintestinus]
MAIQFQSLLHTFSLDDITATFEGLTYADDPSFIDTDGAVVEQMVDKDGNVLSGIDSEFGFYVSDFLGAEDKVLDGDFGEGFAGNIFSTENPDEVVGLALSNAATDVFLSGLPLGTWSLGLGGATVKASTEHYVTMASVLSDQMYPGDPDALGSLDDELRLRDLHLSEVDGSLVEGVKHDLYVEEVTEALQRAIDNNEAGTNPAIYGDIDFDRDGTTDSFRTLSVGVEYDADGDGVAETIQVGAIDLDMDGQADIVDGWLNGYGGEADLTDLMAPNESTVLSDIAYSSDYSVTVKDDGKLLYRWGTAVKRPNDIRMEVHLDLPEEWTADADDNGIADSLEGDAEGFIVTKAHLVITHDITNNPNDQVRPEDYENEAAIGRLPSYYIVTDPDDAENTLWVSIRDSYNGEGDALPSYFKLTEAGEVDMAAGGIAVFNPDGVLVGYRNEDADGNPIGTVFKDESLAELNAAADLPFDTADLAEGYTVDWYTTIDREPFEWSYDKYSDDPYKQDFVSFRSAEEAAQEGYHESDLVSGPRWRLTPNKFGQDLPGLEVPLIENSQPPFQHDNIKYETGEFITTTLNLLDWEGDSPLANSMGWMSIDPTRLDENADGIIDEGWSDVNGMYGSGDAMPTGLILSAVSPNGVNLTQDYFDTSVYLKGDRSDSAKIYDIQLVIEYISDYIGTVQQVDGVSSNGVTVGFQDGATFSNAVVFASPISMNGNDVATVTITNVTSSEVSMYAEEADYLDGGHVPESVSLLTFEEGNWTLDDGTRVEVGEVDVTAGATSRVHTVTFDQEFDEIPNVMVQLQTANGMDWAIVRARNVTSTGFEFAVQEEEASDGFHDAEVVGWVAIDAASADNLIDWGGVASQAFSMEDAVGHNGDSFTFDASLGTDVLVSASMNTMNGRDPAVLRITEMSDDGTSATVEFVAQEEQSLDDEVWHKAETVAGLAFGGAGILIGSETVAAPMSPFDFPLASASEPASAPELTFYQDELLFA